jgi:hypothetical protein
MAHSNFSPPSCIGYRHIPNLVLPLYIRSEVTSFFDEDGTVVSYRRARPLSIVYGAEIVLQSDLELLSRYVHEI